LRKCRLQIDCRHATARLLAPQVFGIYAIVSFVVTFFSTFSDIGIGAALIQKKGNLSREELSTTFWLQQILAWCVVGVVLVIAPLALLVYPSLPPAGVWLIRAMAVSFVFVSLKTIPAILMELEAQEIKGKEALLKTGKKLYENPLKLSDYEPEEIKIAVSEKGNKYPLIDDNIKKLLTPLNSKRRVIFFAGTGGVGKTSVAAATALWIAEKGYKTLLLTTDPASHLGQILETKVNSKPSLFEGEKNLWLANVDAEEATTEYKEKILQEARQKYDEKRILAIEEELNSPCTEEMAVFERLFIWCMQ
jgi:hypothetical protein